MTDVSRGEKWHPLFEYNRLLAKEQHPFCFDQAKTNLLFLLEPRIDLIGQLRVIEHFQMGDKNLTNGLGLAALNQPFNRRAHLGQRRLQTLALNRW